MLVSWFAEAFWEVWGREGRRRKNNEGGMGKKNKEEKRGKGKEKKTARKEAD